METEAAARRTKKRRTGAHQRKEPDEIVSLPPQDLQPRPPATGALHPEPTSHRQGSPPGAGGEEGEDIDRISPLPDAILGEIISLLPTKDGVRTQTLASRWRKLWLSAPLNIDHSSMPADNEVQAGIISRILAVHPGPVRRFSVLHRGATVDAWLRSPALDHLQELEFDEGPWRAEQSLPASAFRFTATLCVFTMRGCRLLDETVKNLRFPQLRQLALVHVIISEVALHGIISGCPVLEHLLLNDICGFRCLRINSPSLKSIAIRSGKLIIEDAPLLQRLLQLQPSRGGLDVSVISAPKVETLGCFDYNSKLVFGTTVIQKWCADSFTTLVCSVKILAFHLYYLNLDMVINLLRCFPCLEKLYLLVTKLIRLFKLLGSSFFSRLLLHQSLIWKLLCVSFPFQPSGKEGRKFWGAVNSDVSRCNNLWRRKHRDLIRCLDIRLKKVELKNYRGIKSQVNFASFFVLNAKMLELMRFEISENDDNEVFIAEQHRSLQLEKRASRDAQFILQLILHGLHVTAILVLSSMSVICL